MSQEQSLQFVIPPEFTQEHQDALIAYLVDNHGLKTAVWQQLFKGIDVLNKAQVITHAATRTFRHAYDELIGQPFSNQYIEDLLATEDVMAESAKIAASYARKIKPTLIDAGVSESGVVDVALFQGYCLYWWQSFARGYAFEVFIMRDLEAANIDFEMHDIRSPLDRYSPADLIVQGLLGDIKTSVYFLQWQLKGKLRNDFYITRLYEKRREQTLVVFQKPAAWRTLEGGDTIAGTMGNILKLLPTPVEIKLRDIILIVVDYETWKEMVHQKQVGEG